MCNDKKLGDPDHFGSILDTREWGIVHQQPDRSLRDKCYLLELHMALEKCLAKQKPFPSEFSKTVDKHF